MALDPATQLKLHAALYTAALPVAAVVAACAPFALVRPLRGMRWGGLAGGVGVAAGFAAAHVGLGAWSGLPPIAVIGWLPVVAAGGCLAGALSDVLAPAPGLEAPPSTPAALAAALPSLASDLRATAVAALHLALRAVVAGAAAYALVRPLVERWSRLEQVGWIGGGALLGATIWTSLDGALARGARAAVPTALAVGLGGLAAAIAVSGSALLGQLAGALGMGSAALAALLLVFPGMRCGYAATGAATATFLAMAAYAHHLADVPLACLLLALLAPAQAAWLGTALLGREPPGGRAGALVGAGKAALAALVPAALAVGLAVAEDRARDQAGGAGSWSAPAAGGEVYLPYNDEPAATDDDGRPGW